MTNSEHVFDANGNSIRTNRYLKDIADEVIRGGEIPMALVGLRARCRPRADPK